MHFIFPSAELASDLYHRTNLMIEPYQLRELTRAGASEIVSAVVEEEISSKLFWTARIRVAEGVILKHLDWWVDTNDKISRSTQNAAFSDFYFNAVIDPLFDRVAMLLTDYLGVTGDNLWCIHHTSRLGDDLVIERGEDYRIVEFERRVLMGDMDVNSRVRERISRRHLRG